MKRTETNDNFIGIKNRRSIPGNIMAARPLRIRPKPLSISLLPLINVARG